MKRLLTQAHFPHYVLFETRSEVLNVYRWLQRYLRQVPDPMAKHQLQRICQSSFRRFSYVTTPRQVIALVKNAKADLNTLTLAINGDAKALRSMLELAYRTYHVREFPIIQLVPWYRECDHSSLIFRMNNLNPPRDAITFEDHQSLKASSPQPFWQLLRLVRKAGITTGKNGRKLVFDPKTIPFNVLGQPLPLSRQRNILRKTYNTFLRDCPRPVHPRVLEHIESRLQNGVRDRKVRRRLEDCARSLYTLNADGEAIQLNLTPYVTSAPSVGA